MQNVINEAISSIQQIISALESSIPNDRHARSCVVQALQDLDQAVVFLEDIEHPKRRLERCTGFEEDEEEYLHEELW